MKHLSKALLLANALGVVLVAHAASPSFPAAAYKSASHTLSFDGKGAFRLTNNSDGKVLVDGGYSVDGTKIAFTDRSGPYACKGDKAKGSYQWKMDGGALIVTKLEDPCDERSGELTAGPWPKK